MKEAQGPSGILAVNRFAQAEVVTYKPFFLVFDPRVELLEERKKTVESVARCSSSQTQSSERSLSSTVSREWDENSIIGAFEQPSLLLTEARLSCHTQGREEVDYRFVPTVLISSLKNVVFLWMGPWK